mgnify:FL=1
MLTISENITIKADVNKIWAFLTDFSKSLNYNRFHTNLELPSNYSVGKMKKFNINHNFGFGNYNMVAEITECIPPNRLCISEYCLNDKKKGFSHSIEFQIEPDMEKSKICYTVIGTYGSKVQDISFKPILKGVMIEELLKIKNAIESSEKVPKPITTETVKPI